MANFKQKMEDKWERKGQHKYQSPTHDQTLRCIPDIDALFKVNMKSVIGKN